MKKDENKKEDECIFCYSLLFSNIEIEYNNISPFVITRCFKGHKKKIIFQIF